MLAAWMAFLGRLAAFGEAQGDAMAAQGPQKGGPIQSSNRDRTGWVGP